MVSIKDPSKLPKLHGQSEEELRAELKDLKLEERSIAFHRSQKMEELHILDTRFREVYYRIQAIERTLIPVKVLPAAGPKVQKVERTVSATEALNVLAKLPANELLRLLQDLQFEESPTEPLSVQLEDDEVGSLEGEETDDF